MKTIGERGQAFSTFKLLIAAIVAVVILVILLSVLNIINFNPQNEPVEGAAEALKKASQSRSLLVKSTTVTFNRGDTLLARTIVESAQQGLARDQVCLSLGEFYEMEEHAGFGGGQENNEENRIVYNGIRRNAQFSVLCYYGDELGDIVRDEYDDIEEDWIDNCSCTGNPQLCCLIALRAPRE